MKKTFISTMLLLISTIFFFGCQHELETPNQQFVFSTDPIFPKTDCDVLVDEEVNLSDGNWSIQELDVSNRSIQESDVSHNDTWIVSLTTEEKNTLFNKISDNEKKLLESIENINSNTGKYEYTFSVYNSKSSYLHKISINNEIISSSTFEMCSEFEVPNDSIKNIFLNIPNKNYKLKDNKIIFMWTDTSSKVAKNHIERIKAISRKEQPIDLYKNTDETKYYYRTLDTGNFYIDFYFHKNS